MKKAVLKWRRNSFWCQGTLIIFDTEGKELSKYSINNYYEVDKDFFCIYDTGGGSDSSYKGELIEKIYIGDCEYEKIYCE